MSEIRLLFVWVYALLALLAFARVWVRLGWGCGVCGVVCDVWGQFEVTSWV